MSVASHRQLSAALVVAASFGGCQCDDGVPPLRPDETLPAGKASTTARRGLGPLASLPRDDVPMFHAGKALARQPWIRAPTTTDARDGLGPLYNSRSCFACHPGGGRGTVPQKNGARVAGGALVRLSVPGDNLTEGVTPEPHYGAQLQTKSVALSSLLGRKTTRKGEVKPEATLTLAWEERPFTYPDGHSVTLRRPEPKLGDLAYGPLRDDAMMSFRNGSPLYGLGLIEAIPAAAIEALVDPDDRNGDGISGRTNYVWDRTAQRRARGIFGHKANQPTLHQQVAAAFAGDIGITNPVFPDQPCTAVQPECNASPSGAGPKGVEIDAELLALVVAYVRDLGVPKRRHAEDPEVLEGRKQFYRAGCAGCHQPSYETSSPHAHLDGHRIWPYADFLLHDMGDGLADGRPDHEATGREWRTAPLWASGYQRKPGASLHLLHDGRARTYEEAILWHGGEATAAREAFVSSSAEDRAALVRFLGSL